MEAFAALPAVTKNLVVSPFGRSHALLGPGPCGGPRCRPPCPGAGAGGAFTVRHDHPAVEVVSVAEDGHVLAVLGQAGGTPDVGIRGGAGHRTGRRNHEAGIGVHYDLHVRGEPVVAAGRTDVPVADRDQKCRPRSTTGQRYQPGGRRAPARATVRAFGSSCTPLTTRHRTAGPAAAWSGGHPQPRERLHRHPFSLQHPSHTAEMPSSRPYATRFTRWARMSGQLSPARTPPARLLLAASSGTPETTGHRRRSCVSDLPQRSARHGRPPHPRTPR